MGRGSRGRESKGKPKNKKKSNANRGREVPKPRRKIHIEDELWQYHLSGRQIRLAGPDGRLYRVRVEDINAPGYEFTPGTLKDYIWTEILGKSIGPPSAENDYVALQMKEGDGYIGRMRGGYLRKYSQVLPHEVRNRSIRSVTDVNSRARFNFRSRKGDVFSSRRVYI